MGIRTAKPKHWTRPDRGLPRLRNLPDCRRWHKLSASGPRPDLDCRSDGSAGTVIEAKRRPDWVGERGGPGLSKDRSQFRRKISARPSSAAALDVYFANP